MSVPKFLNVLYKRHAIFNEKDHIKKMSEKASLFVSNNIIFKNDFGLIKKEFERLKQGKNPNILKLEYPISSIEEMPHKDMYWLLFPVNVVRSSLKSEDVDNEFIEKLKNLSRANNHSFFFGSFKELFVGCSNLNILQTLPAYLLVPIKVFKLKVEIGGREEDVFRVYADAYIVKRNIAF